MRPGLGEQSSTPLRSSVEDENVLQYGTGGKPDYGGSAINHLGRSVLYKENAWPPVGQLEEGGEFYGYEGEMIKSLNLTGNETIVDIGCGDGSFPELLYDTGHKGKIIGINNSANHFVRAELELEATTVSFLEEDATSLSLADNSADVVCQKNLLHHLGFLERQDAIREALRILTPGGRYLIAVRNTGNQARIWNSLSELAQEIKSMSDDYDELQPPVSFYERFNMEKAKLLCRKKGLVVVSEYMQSTDQANSEIRLPAKHESADQAWEKYQFAIMTLRSAFREAIPRGTVMQEALDKSDIKKRFFQEIEINGYFREPIEQGFLVARKPE